MPRGRCLLNYPRTSVLRELLLQFRALLQINRRPRAVASRVGLSVRAATGWPRQADRLLGLRRVNETIEPGQFHEEVP